MPKTILYMIILMLAVWAAWFASIFYHVFRFRTPKDKSIVALASFSLFSIVTFLATVFFLAGVEWSSKWL